MTKPLIYLITRGEATDEDFAAASRDILATVKLAVDEGVSLIQIREKNISAKSLFDLASAASAITRESQTRLLVNDRADIAHAAGADGVHLTSTSLPANVIRVSFPKTFLIGVSTHTLDETIEASTSGADLAVFGPVFSTPGKGVPTGLAVLAEVCGHVAPFPVLAIGGIDETNCESTIAAGASGVAAIRSLNDPVSLRDICRKLKR